RPGAGSGRDRLPRQGRAGDGHGRDRRGRARDQRAGCHHGRVPEVPQVRRREVRHGLRQEGQGERRLPRGPRRASRGARPLIYRLTPGPPRGPCGGEKEGITIMDKYTWEGDDLNSIDTSAEARLYCPAHGRPFTYRNIKPSLI